MDLVCQDTAHLQETAYCYNSFIQKKKKNFSFRVLLVTAEKCEH